MAGIKLNIHRSLLDSGWWSGAGDRGDPAPV
jgi:hypothetical protein